MESAATTATKAARETLAASPSAASYRLPSRPLITIQPRGPWGALNLRELWAYRELLYFLAMRDVKIRYKQTALGVAWAVLQPVLMMLIFTIFLGRFALAGGSVPYPLFVFAGLVPWTSFANAVGTAGNSLVNSAGLVTKVYFPRLLVPMGAVLAGFVDFLLPFGILLGMLVYYHVPLTAHIALLPILVLLTHLFALAVGTRLAALNVKYRDVRFVLPFLIQIWMFVSSVILPSTSVPKKFQWLLLLNPMSGFIEGYRSALFGQPFDWRALAIATGLTIAMFIYSAYSFRRAERVFADII